MGTLGKFFAAICAILFIVTSIIVLLLINIESKAFSSATYKQAFADQGLYQRMPVLMASMLQSSIAENPNAIPLLTSLSAANWETSINTLLPPEEMKAVADDALDSTFDYLNGKTDSAVISLLPIKAHLASASGLQVVNQFLSLQPACTPEQLSQMALGLLSGQITLCNPPQEAMGLMAPFVQSQLQVITSLIPDQLTFIPGTLSHTPNDPRLKLNTVRSTIKFTPFVPLFLLIGIAVFGVRTLKDWLTWWGWPLLLTGILSVFIGLLGSPIVGWILRLLIERQGTILIPAVLANSLGETASAVAHQMLLPVLVQGAILAVVGFGMVVLTVFIIRRPEDQVLPY